jgi:predicted esterase
MTALVLAILVAGGVDVSVETAGGETLTGKVTLTDLKMKTDFGSAVVLADKIAQITFGEPDVVVTKGDEEVRGEITLASLKIETAAGAKTLKRKDLKSLVVIEGGRGGATDFNGSWMLTSGNLQCPLTLKQSGLKVTGKYGHREEFSLEGKVKGSSLAFTLREGGGGGEGTAELWEGGQFFLGEVKYGNEKLLFAAYRRAARPAEAKPGEITEGQSEAGLLYFLRVPKEHDGKRKFPMIVITHGSNANSKDYVGTFPATWPELAEDYIIVGVNGERLAQGSTPGNVGHNATYINFGGPEVGQPFAYRQTPALLAETVQELVKRLPVERVFLGGHSQGGFLTYATFLYYPELFAGAFPMSCNLLVQCEPGNFKEDALEKQLRIAVAPIHGKADDVVEFTGGDYCHKRMQEFGFPRLHLFAPDRVGHGFMFLPVEEAIRWLEAMTSEDPAALLDFAEKQLAAEEWRDAMGAVLRAREFDKAGALKARADEIAKKVDAKCAPDAKRLEDAIAKGKGNGWVDDFWEFRRQFACAPAAEDCIRAYEKLKEAHTKPANELFWAARNERDDAARKSKYKEIVDKYYASSWWILVKDWVK